MEVSSKSSEIPPAYSDIPPEAPPGYLQQAGYGPPVGYCPPPGHILPAGYAYPYCYTQPEPGVVQQPPYYCSTVVVAQPVTTYQPYIEPRINYYLFVAIFVTLCCFWPTGIVAIIRACDARSALSRGDVPAANSYARSAKSMVTISVIIGVTSIVLLAIILVVSIILQ